MCVSGPVLSFVFFLVWLYLFTIETRKEKKKSLAPKTVEGLSRSDLYFSEQIASIDRSSNFIALPDGLLCRPEQQEDKHREEEERSLSETHRDVSNVLFVADPVQWGSKTMCGVDIAPCGAGI